MYLISACLIGENVRYDGGNTLHDVARQLIDAGKVIPVCPEVFGGMSTHRIPSEIKGDKVVSKEGVDVSHYFTKGAQQTLDIALKNNVKIAIFQTRSPSCGSTEIYDGSFTGKLIEGKGVTTQLLEQNGIAVITIDEYIRDYYEQDF